MIQILEVLSKSKGIKGPKILELGRLWSPKVKGQGANLNRKGGLFLASLDSKITEA